MHATPTTPRARLDARRLRWLAAFAALASFAALQACNGGGSSSSFVPGAGAPAAPPASAPPPAPHAATADANQQAFLLYTSNAPDE